MMYATEISFYSLIIILYSSSVSDALIIQELNYGFNWTVWARKEIRLKEGVVEEHPENKGKGDNKDLLSIFCQRMENSNHAETYQQLQVQKEVSATPNYTDLWIQVKSWKLEIN